MDFQKIKLRIKTKLAATMLLTTALVSVFGMPVYSMKRSRNQIKKYHFTFSSNTCYKLCANGQGEPKLVKFEDRQSEKFKQVWDRIFIHRPTISDLEFFSFGNLNANKYNVKSVLSQKVSPEFFILPSNDITTDDKIVDSPLDWSQFSPCCNSEKFLKKGEHLLNDSFWGILNFITISSNNKFNKNELEIYFTGAEKYTDPNEREKFINSPYKSDFFNPYDAFNLLPINYNSPVYYFIVNSDNAGHVSNFNKIVGFRFKNIKIVPFGFSIKCHHSRNINQNAAPAGIRFWAMDDDDNVILLFEKVNSNDLIPAGSYNFYHCRTTTRNFSKFAVEMFDSNANNNLIPFLIGAIEIHAKKVTLKKDIPKSAPVQTDLTDLNSDNFNNNFDFKDPCIDMTDFI